MVEVVSGGFILEDQASQISLKEFKFQRFSDRLNDDCFHYSASHPQFKFEGFGTAFDEKLAVKIAVSECLERFHFGKLSKSLGTRTSSGFAVHETQEKANESAICELLERDAVLVSWLTHKSPQWLSSSEFSRKTQDHLFVFRENNFEVRIGLLCRSNKRYCLIGALLPSCNNRAVFSASCSKDLDEGAFGIIKELRRAATAVVNRDSGHGHENKGLRAAEKHFLHYLQPENFGNIKAYLENSSSTVPEHSFEIETIELPMEFKSTWPLYLSYAQSQVVQNFYFGAPKYSDINRKRLKSIFKIGNKLNKDLHVLP